MRSATPSAPVPRGATVGLLLGLLVAGIAAMFWLVGDGGEPELDVDLPDATSASVDAANASKPTQTGDGVVDADAKREEVRGTAEAAAEKEPDKRTRHHVRVRVVDARTGSPVADATVAADPYFFGPVPRARALAEPRLPDRFELNLLHGQVVTTDVEGVAYVKVKGSTIVGAQKGDLSASALLDLEKLGPDGLELRLRPTRRVTVNVVDVVGAVCADVPIGLRASWSAEPTGHQFECWFLGFTDENGALSARVDSQLRGRSWPPILEAYVAAPGLAAVHAKVSQSREPVRLQLPPFGSVRVRAVGVDGQPIPDLPNWSARLDGLGAAGVKEYLGEVARTFVGENGEVVFPRVGLGIECSIRLYGSTSEGANTKLRGPGRAGEEVVHVFDVRAKTSYSASGRLLGADGAPLAEVRALFREPSGGTEETRTDAEGRFALRLRVRKEAPLVQISPSAILADGRPCWFDPIDVRLGVAADVGDLRAKESTLVATGEVISDSGLPPGLQLFVREQNAPPLTSYDVVVEDDGKFAIYRLQGQPVGKTQLHVNAVGFAAVPAIPFVMGQTLRVELHRGVYFRGRIVVDPAILSYVEHSALDLVMTHESGDRNLIRGTLEDGEFVFESAVQRAGMYQLAVESGDASDDLAQMEAVRLAPGEPTDPRLQPWDLRSEIQMRTIRLVKPDRTPLPVSGNVQRKRALDGDWENCASFDRGIARCITTMVPSDLMIWVEDHGWFLRRHVMGDLEVSVPEPHDFHIVFDGLPAIPREARVSVVTKTGPEWGRAQGLPDGYSPVIRSSLKRNSNQVDVRIVEPMAVTLSFVVRANDQQQTVHTENVVLEAGKPEVHVQAPQQLVARIAQLVGSIQPGGR